MQEFYTRFSNYYFCYFYSVKYYWEIVLEFKTLVKTSDIILTEGGMVERINRDPSVKLDPFIAHSGLVYNTNGRNVLEKIYREYIDIAQKHNLPMLSLAPTWRANPDRINKSNFRNYKNINKNCVDFLKQIRESYAEFSSSIFIGGGLFTCPSTWQCGGAGVLLVMSLS